MNIQEQIEALRNKFEAITNTVGADRLTVCGMYVNYRLEKTWRKYRDSRMKRNKL
jgi:hypothetical protein